MCGLHALYYFSLCSGVIESMKINVLFLCGVCLFDGLDEGCVERHLSELCLHILTSTLA